MLTFPSNMPQTILEMRTLVGRSVTAVTIVNTTICGDCTLDPLTGISINPFCSTCGGIGYLTTLDETDYLAHIRWTQVDTVHFSPGGFINVGDCVVTIEYSPTVLTVVDNADHWVVDNKKMYLLEYDLRGIPDINRIRLHLGQDPPEIS